MEDQTRRTRTRKRRINTILTFIIAIASLLAPTYIDADLYTDTEYAFRLDPITPLPSGLTWTKSSVSDVDDGPYDRVPFVHFNFPFFYRAFAQVGINPNGALHLPSPYPCECLNGGYPSFLTTACDFDTGYFNMIAAFHTDLFPNTTQGALVEYSQNPDSFYVRYTNVRMFIEPSYNVSIYGPIPAVTFSIELHRTGVIFVRYPSIVDPSKYTGWGTQAYARVWMVGLRQGDPTAATGLVPASVQTLNHQDWNTTQNGTYPPRSQVVSGKQITFWPFGSVACNSPSLGDVYTQSTYIYLKNWFDLADFNLTCIFNGDISTPGFLLNKATYDAAKNAFQCFVPPLLDSSQIGTTLQISLYTSVTGILPLTPMSFTYYATSDPMWLRYKELLAKAGSDPANGDMRVCYECARMKPDLCLADNTISNGMCNTPQIGKPDGTTSTVVLTESYPFAERLEQGLIEKIWCVWTDVTQSSSPPSAALNPNNLNPWFNNVTWVEAQLFPNVSWIVCTPPNRGYDYPVGTTFNLSLAENNFVFAGGLGPVGAGSQEPSFIQGYGNPPGKENNDHLTMQYKIVAANDPQLVAYEDMNYFSSFLFSTNLNSSSASIIGSSAFTSTGAPISPLDITPRLPTFNLQTLCTNCARRFLDTYLQSGTLHVPSSASSSSSTTSTTTTNQLQLSGFCPIPTNAAQENKPPVKLCISPSIGDISLANNTVSLFPNKNYDLLARYEMFNLSCVMRNYYTINDSSILNITVIDNVIQTNYVDVWTCGTVSGIQVCANISTPINSTIQVPRWYTKVVFTPTYIPVGEPVWTPMRLDTVQRLFSCDVPPVDVFPWTSLQVQYPNLTLSSLLVTIGENNRLIEFVNPPIFDYVAPDDHRWLEWSAGRSASPPIPPWGSCFSCDPQFRSSVPLSEFSVLPDGSSYCYTSVNAPGLLYFPICNSPGVSSQYQDQGNSSIQLFTNQAYPISKRASLTAIYCKFALPPVYTYYFNTSTNMTTATLQPPLLPPVFQPVYWYDLTHGYAVCSPPPYAVFQSKNLSVTLYEYQDPLPFPPFTHTYVADNDANLAFYKSTGGRFPLTYSTQQFCTDCHGYNIGGVPGFTPYSPVGVAGLCFLDCSHLWNGEARYDDCGICSEGSTGKVPNVDLDCMNTCFGPFVTRNGPLPNGGVGTFNYCECHSRSACFNISVQPLIGVNKHPPIPGQPQLDPINIASVGSQQFLLKSFVIPRIPREANGTANANAGEYDLHVDPLNSHPPTYTPDPDFDSPGWTQIPPSNWFGTTSTPGTTVDPFTIPLGFTFPFFESVYSTVYLSSSGAILFTSPATYLSYLASCFGIPAGTDPRIRNLGLLKTLFQDPEFANKCADVNMILPYFTYLDPTLDPSTTTLQLEQQQAVAALLAMGMPTNHSASVSYILGTTAASNPSLPPEAVSGSFLSIKFENVPYNYVAYNPWRAGPQPASFQMKPFNSSVTKTPLYSFQVTLYQTGKISLKLFNVTDPLLGTGPGTIGGGFNTSAPLNNLVVGFIDRPFPSSVLTQSAPGSNYVTQMSLTHVQQPYDVEGAIAMQRQKQWLPSSAVPIGVFPPRTVMSSGSHHIFCPFPINACAYPRAGPSTGGTFLTVSLLNLQQDYGCIHKLLNLTCVFGDSTLGGGRSQAWYNDTTKTLSCITPAGSALSTVPLLLMEGSRTLITSNKLFWSWLPLGDTRLEVVEYNFELAQTRITHVTGVGDPDVNNTLTEFGYHLEFCKLCSEFNPPYCPVDCAGTFFGSAFIDDCGNCTSGTTGLLPNFGKDCSGVCFGNSVIQPSAIGGSGSDAVQCICQPFKSPSCQASALTKINPLPTLGTQYVYHLHPSLIPYPAKSLTPIPIWTVAEFPSTAKTEIAPFPDPLLIEVALPFVFQFYAQSLRTIWISSFGGIFLAKPSAACLSEGVTRLFRDTANTTCPYQMLIGSITEWDWTASNGSKIIYYDGLSDTGVMMYTVVFLDFYTLYDSTQHHSFQIQLLSSPAGAFTISYKDGRDPNSLAKDVAAGVTQEFPPRISPIFLKEWEEPLAPAYAFEEPHWLFGAVLQTWYTTPNVYSSIQSQNLTREISLPFPYSMPARYVGTREQKRFLPRSNTSLGTFPDRLGFTAGTQYQYCMLGLDFCMNPTWGPEEGGVLVRFFSKDWGCASMVDPATNLTLTTCCASQLDLECVFGNTVTVPATFNTASLTADCIAPPGIPNSAVQVYLAEGGRRIGSKQNFMFAYNTTQVAMDMLGVNLTYYGTDAFACESCVAALSPLSRQATNPPGFCVRDCANTFRGSATLDSCGVCTGGATGREPESARDCRGTCFGPFILRNITLTSDDSRYETCTCDEGNDACAYSPVMDGPISASQTMIMAPYQLMLIALAIFGALFVCNQAIFGYRMWRPEAEDAPVAAAPGGGDGAAVAPGAAAASALLPPSGASSRRARGAADALLGAAGGLERRSRRSRRERRSQERAGGEGGDPAPPRRERRSERPAESAAPSAAAAAALDADDD